MTTGIHGGLRDEPLDHIKVASRAPDEWERSDVFGCGWQRSRNEGRRRHHRRIWKGEIARSSGDPEEQQEKGKMIGYSGVDAAVVVEVEEDNE